MMSLPTLTTAAHLTGHPCPCGLAPLTDGPSCWIRSLRTGRSLTLARDIAVRYLPASMLARIERGGRQRFSTEELRAFADAVAVVKQPEIRPAAVSALAGVRKGKQW